MQRCAVGQKVGVERPQQCVVHSDGHEDAVVQEIGERSAADALNDLGKQHVSAVDEELMSALL